MREVTLPFSWSEERDWAAGSGVVETLPLIIDEKKQFVLHDRTAKRGPKHVPAECGLGETVKIVGPVAGVKDIVPEELEDVAVIAVGAVLDGSTDNAPLELPELSGSVLGYQAKFLNRVHTRSKPNQVVRHLVVIHAVEQEIVGLLTVPVDMRSATEWAVPAV